MDTATLTFGSDGSGPSAALAGILATFDIAVGLPGNFSFSATGKFSLSIANMVAQVPNVVKAEASGILVQYDPAAGPSQELVRIRSASLTFPTFGLTGQIDQIPDPNHAGQFIPGLVVRGNGFTLGQAVLRFTPSAGNTIGISGILEFKDLRIGVTNFDVTFGSAFVFNGSIFFASGGATLFKNGPVSAEITDRQSGDDVNPDGTPNDEALRADLVFKNGAVDRIKFKIDTLKATLGSFLVLTAQDFQLDTGAQNDERVLNLGSVGAVVKIGGLEISGEARNFGFTARGDFVGGFVSPTTGQLDPSKPFGVILSIGGTSGSSLGWPDWLPVKITTLGVEFATHNNQVDFSDFTIILSASVSGLPSVGGLEFSGSIEGVRIKPSLLAQGKFPIISIQSFGVSISGELFGGELNAGLIGGILQIYQVRPGVFDWVRDNQTVPDDQVVDRILFVGIQGGFTVAGLGLNIRLGLSELGPLGVFINVEIPGGIVIVPQIGLAINDFSAGVEFFKTLPSIDKPEQLRDPAFSVQVTVDAASWLAGIKDQVFRQYLAIKANPNMNGFAAAFASPMLIKGSAKVYDIYTSEALFNGQVDLIISTDGKFLIAGKLNFLDGALSVSAKLYGDFSNVSSGSVVVLFLADIPDQVRFLTIDGRIKMGFRNASGDEVEIPVANVNPGALNVPTTGNLASPGQGEGADVAKLNSNVSEDNTSHYIDVTFEAGTKNTLDYGTIVDGDSEIGGQIVKVDGSVLTLTFNGAAIPVDTIDIDGAPQPIEGVTLTKSASFAAHTAGTITLDHDGSSIFSVSVTELSKYSALTSGVFELDRDPSRLKSVSIHGIALSLSEYTITGRSIQLTPGSTPNPNDDVLVVYETTDFTRSGHDLTLANQTTKTTQASVTYVADASGDVLKALLAQRSIKRFRYRITNAGFEWSSGAVEVMFVTGSWAQADGTTNPAAPSQTFTVLGPTATLVSPAQGSQMPASQLPQSEAAGGRYVDILFLPTATGGASIDDGALTGTPIVPVMGGPGKGSATIHGPPVLQPTTFNETKKFSDLTGGLFTLGHAPIAASVSVTLGVRKLGSAEFTLSGSDLTLSLDPTKPAPSSTDSVVVLYQSNDPAPNGGRIYRYTLTGDFVPGDVTLTFTADSFHDTSTQQFANTEQVLTFTVTGSSASLAAPVAGSTIGLTVLQSQGYIDVTFAPASGASIDASTVLDPDPELSVRMADGQSLDITGQPTQIEVGGNVFRYTFTTTLVPGPVTVTFLAGSFADTDGVVNLEKAQSFVVAQPTAALTNLADGSSYFDAALDDSSGRLFDGSGDRYIELALSPVKGATVPTGPVLDTSHVSLNYALRLSETKTFGQLSCGAFVLGTTPTDILLVTVAGNPLAAGSYTLTGQTLTLATGVTADSADKVSVIYRASASGLTGLPTIASIARVPDQPNQPVRV